MMLKETKIQNAARQTEKAANLACSGKRLNVASQGVREKLAEAATRSRWNKATVKYWLQWNR